MLAHLRANLWLVFLTAVLCCVAYPLALWAIGQTPPFRQQAEGSFVPGERGSRLIAQPFRSDLYFQPRPSAGSLGYDASASSGSNLAASNPLLRDRVARQLGTLAKYPGGKLAGADVEAWFAVQPKGFAARWAAAHPVLAKQWISDNSEAVAAWLDKEEKAIKDDTAAAAGEFFVNYCERAEKNEDKATWPTSATRNEGDKAVKRIEAARTGDDVRAYLFESWLQDPQNREKAALIVPVPADLVTASGSGLDPHITLDGAKYQIDRVARAWAEKTGKSATRLAADLETFLTDRSAAPLGGLAGVPLVNVLEVNAELEAWVKARGE